MFDQEYMNAFQTCSAQALVEDRGRRRLQKEQQRRERIEDAVEANKDHLTYGGRIKGYCRRITRTKSHIAVSN